VAPETGGVDPAHPGTPGVNELPRTGGSLPLGLAATALVLVFAGGAVLFWRRRKA
jgi:LPXTG-motif cell wall-anchored protein